MNDLLKISRAMKDSDDWRRMVEVACLKMGRPFDENILLAVTSACINEIEVSDETLEIDVEGVEVGDVLEAAETFEPPPEYVPELGARLLAAEKAVGEVPELYAMLGDLNYAVGKLSEWVQPGGAHDAFMAGAEVEVGGVVWVSLIDYNVWPPGTSGWRQKPTDEGPAPWTQPSGATDVYQVGDRVTFGGEVWESTAANNVWQPGVYGWVKG